MGDVRVPYHCVCTRNGVLRMSQETGVELARSTRSGCLPRFQTILVGLVLGQVVSLKNNDPQRGGPYHWQVDRTSYFAVGISHSTLLRFPAATNLL